MKRIGVLTSGGDCSGMNATIRAVVRTAMNTGVEVVGFQKGYRGLIDRHYEIMQNRSVSNVLQRGGTFLQSARCREMLEEAGQAIAADTLKGLGVEGLVVIGGDGSLRGARALANRGVRVIGIPASIDNDISHTEMSLGVDTALNNIIYAVDCLKDTASSHDRAFVVECMGRNSGYLTLAATVASGAEHAIIPETPFDLEAICASLRRRYQEGRFNSIIMVAEGAGSAQEIAARIKDRIGFETRVMVLGHYQRGGSPSAFDRLLAARFGTAAVEALLAGESGKMVGLSSGAMVLTELDLVLASGIRPIDRMMVQLADKLT
ncbi:6-phosphofructokinase [Geothermobacter ehrlichii]|uniref:ATP-dependent 6-phosphofructokinase n=1 Tax=Geothermobacter ehrlichii TaxID=213224 RepID=A0A5D3WKA2_9BACT|nr:6-phosphofructokinase [Geothermobacter ehrlichii]TYO98784.1 6-phosphofructokinase [Geothermobacter ehrlichii]